jgi:putative endonuclease
VDARRKFGNDGEALAAEYLVRKGFLIRGTQVRTPVGEIDIVAEHGNELVFVEVKTRIGNSHGYPEESITPAKWRHMCQSAETYMAEHALQERPFRIDVMAIQIHAAGPEILHFEAVDGPYGR